MENDEESLRLEFKTNDQAIIEQATWAGIKPGMRVADLGCGPGRTSSVLHKLVGSDGEVLGLDFSESRIWYANEHYRQNGVHFVCRDIREQLDDLGSFDFVWLRFVLEYNLAESFDIVKNITRLLKPDGIICLIDLDNNCLNHYGIPERLEKTVLEIMELLQARANFDPYAGRKLYSFLYDLQYRDIQAAVSGHHVIYGELQESDAFNWLKKVEVAPQKVGYTFDRYPGGNEEFLAEFKKFFSDPRRFTYSPIVLCAGKKP